MTSTSNTIIPTPIQTTRPTQTTTLAQTIQPVQTDITPHSKLLDCLLRVALIITILVAIIYFLKTHIS